MDFGDYVRLIRRSAWIIVALVLVGVLGASAYTLTQKPVFGATATGIVSARATSVQDLGQVGTVTQAAVTNLTQVATSSYVLSRVIDELDLKTTPQELASRIAAAAPGTASVITVSASAGTGQQAADIANAVMTQLNSSLGQLIPGSDARAVSLRLLTVNAAIAPTSADSPKPLRNIALGALVGLALALLIAVIRQLLDSRMTTSHDLERVTDRPVLGQFLREERAPRSIPTSAAFAASPGAEAVRTLRTNLRFLEGPSAVRALVVTSPSANEDRTEMAAALAIAMADLGRRVLVVDADLRRAKLAAYLDVDGAVGLTDVLSGRAAPEAAFQQWGRGMLHVLAAGAATDRPNELIQSDAMADLVARLRSEFDVVVFNTPPLLVASDAAVVANYTNGALVVVEMGRTTRTQLVSALTALDRVSAETVGLVATGLREAPRSSRYTRRPRRLARQPRLEAEPKSWTVNPDAGAS